jgi:hypothetical protein
MSDPIGITGFEGVPAGASPAAPPARGAGGPAFSELLDAIAAEGGEPQPQGPSPTVTAYNTLNLLNGRFPPPDSGAGFLFTVVAMHQEATL